MRELVASDGAPIDPGAEAQAEQLSRTQRSVRKGARMMLVTLALALVGGLLTVMNDDFAIFLIPVAICFIVGFARVLHGVFLAEKRALKVKGAALSTHAVPVMPGQLDAAARSPELSPPQVAPVQSFTAQRAETAEMVRPSSVTENTTKLLDEESDPRRR